MMASPPLVQPSAVILESASFIVYCSEPDVPESTTVSSPAYVTMLTLSFSSRFSASMANDCCTSGSLLSSYMDPEVSIRNTRFEGFLSPKSISSVLIPTIMSFVALFHGQSEYSVYMENFSPSSGFLL